MANVTESKGATPPSGAPGLVPVDLDFHLLDRLAAVHRHRRLAITVFLLVVMVMMLQSYSTVPMFRAQARLLIEDERSTMVMGMSPNDPSFWMDPAPYFETQYEILRSRGLAERVVEKLTLSGIPELTGQDSEPRGIITELRSARRSLFFSMRSLLSGPPPEEGAAAGTDETATVTAQAQALLSSLQVLPLEGTHLVDITVEGRNPEFAALAVNTLIGEYVQQNLDQRLQSTDKTLGWLEEELRRQQRKVVEGERALADYREAQDALSLDDRQNIVVARLNQLNDAVTRAQTTRVQKQALYAQVRDVSPDSAAVGSFPAIVQNPAVQGLRANLGDLESEKARLSERYGERHPDIVNLTVSIEAVSRQLRAQIVSALEAIRNDYESALAEERNLRAQLEAQKRAAMDLDSKHVSYTVLQREAESTRMVYEGLLGREKELQVVANNRANNARVVDPAEVPPGPFTPNPRRDWVMATVLGLMLGIGLVFGVEYLDDTIKTPEDVTRKLGRPLLGLVPTARGKHAPLLSGAVPHDFGEAFRSLRTSLVFTSGGKSTRIVAVTSTQPLEGKTATSCNIAMVLALGGHRVLLIDADMRRPSLHRAMGLSNAIGLSHVLTGQAKIREGVQRTHDPNLFVLSGGLPPPNPSELLSSDRMKHFLTSLVNGPFDWVIIDTPPVVAVTDAVLLMPAVSGVAFVIGSEMTRLGHCQRALEMLQSTGHLHLLGVVLNRVDFDRNKYYYTRYYGHSYKNYYGEAAASAA